MTQAYRPLSFLLLCAITLTAIAATPYATLRDKANRAFKHEEWASASALFDLMLDQCPDSAQTYGKAIVANAKVPNEEAQARLLAMALDNHIPFDSVFSGVKTWSYNTCSPEIYENFLKNSRDSYPWMARTLNGNLLKFYTLHRNGEQMVAYSKIMLNGAPDNIDFLTTMARGYLLIGDTTDAIHTYEQILAINPNHYDTLLWLGNWYAGQPTAANQALTYLNRANAIKSTPYVTTLITQLKQQ
jgi:tetratricopeptide (TPR) repeat protein